jgi:hypothetical protein
MGYLEGSGVPVLYIGRTVPKGFGFQVPGKLISTIKTAYKHLSDIFHLIQVAVAVCCCFTAFSC